MNSKESIIKIKSIIEKVDKLIHRLPTSKLIRPEFKKFKSKNFKSKNFKKTKLAYVTMVFGTEVYIPACLALAHCLDTHKHKYNKVCLVQYKPTYKMIDGKKTYFSGISKQTIHDLLKVYDIVYGIKLLQVESSAPNNHFSKAIKHYKNISIYPTKCQIFGLLDYDRIIYIDSSTIVNKNIDYMFKNYTGNTFLLDKEYTTTKMGLAAGIFIFSPSAFFYTKMYYILHNYNKLFKNLDFCRGTDELIIYFTVYPTWSTKLIKLWTSCPEKFKEHKCPFYKYQLFKPFKKNVNKAWGEHPYDEWDKVVKNLLKTYPKFKTYFSHIKEFRTPGFSA
jgi:alpha-N-acetylglucosamine transferase